MKNFVFLVLLFKIFLNQINIGEEVCLGSGLNLRKGPCLEIIRSTRGTERGKVLGIERKQCSFGQFTWYNIRINNENVWGAFETNLIQKCSTNSRNYNVPMVHQRWYHHFMKLKGHR
jgi:hypothetical protein